MRKGQELPDNPTRTLVDLRIVGNANPVGVNGAIRWTTVLKDAGVKKAVNAKVSKGRKLKYEAKEKPVEGKSDN
ncbi:hypothetical protein HOY82DRAFT_611951 [Tuber indicum]|nr:hypothetical protein HOY82DRAFT_611951 [Tuber indicum]